MATTNQAEITPRVVSLGKVKRSQAKKLKNGFGKLVDEIHQIAAHEIAKLPDPGEGKSYQPVIIVHRRMPDTPFMVGNKASRKRLRKYFGLDDDDD